MKSNTPAAQEKLIPLPINPEANRVPVTAKQRFKIIAFENNSGKTHSWRVIGTNRQGKQIRENFKELKTAQCRQVELMSDYLGRQPEDNSLRATTLTDTQLRIAEACFPRFDSDEEMFSATDHWVNHGKQHTVPKSERLDEAVKKFKKWLDDKPDESGGNPCTLREHSRKGLRLRVSAFGEWTRNYRIDEITPDIVESFLGKKLPNVSAVTRDNYRRAISRFFSWCIQRPRRWTRVNPCKEIRIDKPEQQPPAILTGEQSEALLRAAERRGLAPYVSICLMAGLRPFEVSRLDWKAINLGDREIRLEGHQTKTGRPRVVGICNTLYAWLSAYEGKPLFPKNWRRKFDSAKEAAGLVKRETAKSKGTFIKKKKGKLVKARRYWKRLTPLNWSPDILRHTAISHFFRKTGSYGLTAEQFGNSEAIIKKHYQGRVSSEDTAKFYALRPKK